MNITELQHEIYATACEKGWHDRPLCITRATADQPPQGVDPIAVLAKLVLVHSELSEAEEEAAAGLFDVYYNASNPTKPEGWIVEIADSLIRVLDTCEALGLDIESAVKSSRFGARPSLHAYVSKAVEAARVGDYTEGFTNALAGLWQACEVEADQRSRDNLAHVITLKIAYNRTRSHMHGGKLA